MKNVEAPGLLIPGIEDITRRDFLIGAGGLLVLAPYGCGGGESAAPDGADAGAGFPRTVKHASGETILERRPTRVYDISYQGAWVLLSFGVTPVEYQMHAERAEDFRSLARTIGIEIDVVEIGEAANIEAIAAAEPDLILGAEYLTDPVREELEQLAPVIDIPGPGDGGWRKNVRLVGDVLGEPEKAEDIISETERRILAAAEPYDLRGATFAFLSPGIYDGLVYVCNDETYAPADILLAAGMEMAPEVAGLGGDVCTGVSLERIGEILETSDLLVLSEVWDSSMEEFAAMPVIAAIPAIKEERYVLVSGPSDQTVALDVFAPSLVDIVVPVIEEIGEKYQSIR